MSGVLRINKVSNTTFNNHTLTYKSGFAFGTVLREQTNGFINAAWNYILSDLETVLYPHLPKWVANLIAEVGLDVALDKVYDMTVSYTDIDFYDELHGLSDGISNQ